jgi:hypothetical protein
MTILSTRFLIRAALFVAGLAVFILGLEVLKKGAGGLKFLFDSDSIHGLASAIGLGWLGACVLLSGSPAAAISLTILAGGTIGARESFAMITGSRLGASFVVLLIGAIDDFRNRRGEKRAAYIGVSAILVTAIVYLPALGLGIFAIDRGAFEGLRFEGRALASFVDVTFGPPSRWLAAHLPTLVTLGLGVVILLSGLRLFDRSLPEFTENTFSTRIRRDVIYRPWVMFAFGLGVTAVTMSVAVSISLLVPLTSRGFVRRENLFPYMLGANITTFVDTLFAAALVGHPDAVRVVAVQMAVVTLLTIPIVFLFPYRFERLVDAAARRITAGTRPLALFLCILFAIPLSLVLLFA